MKQQNKILIYDGDCPLCAAYTKAFVKTGMLDNEGRQSFIQVKEEIFALVDDKKCFNEIPLVDIETKQVWYGIDALLEILNGKFRGIKEIGNLRFIKWFLQKLYKLISYNRKVIVAKHVKDGEAFNPDFNASYRTAFLVVFLVFNSLMLYPYHNTVFNKSFMAANSLADLQVAHFFLVAVTIGLAMNMRRKTAYEFIGQVNMLALMTILLLLPLHIINLTLNLRNYTLNNLYLAGLSVFVIRHYFRRMRYAGVLKNYPRLVGLNLMALALFLIFLIY